MIALSCICVFLLLVCIWFYIAYTKSCDYIVEQIGRNTLQRKEMLKLTNEMILLDRRIVRLKEITK